MRLISRPASLTAALALGLLAALAFVALARPHVARAQPEPVRFTGFGMESQFPEGVRFFGQVEADVPVEDIRVIYEVGVRDVTQYDYMALSGSGLVDGELIVRTDSPERYIPPGAVIKFRLEVFAQGGASYLSEQREQVLTDARYEWDMVTDGPITVYFHGPVQTRAETLAAQTRAALNIMQPVTDAEIETPINLVLYNNYAEMIGAVVPRSTTISRELITEGQAFDSENTVLVLAGQSDIGTATHEITHILVARASAGSTFVPFWLNEGLAEYGNQDPTVDFTLYLEWGIGTRRLMTLASLSRAPSDPDLTLVGYGEGRSAVRFMVQQFGAEKMAELLATLGQGIPIDRAVPLTYDMSFAELEDQWRKSIGADPYVPPTPAPATPTPLATATPNVSLPFTLDSVAAAGQATATPQATATEDETPAPSSGGSCNAGPDGRAEGSFGLGLIALLGFSGWRLWRRR